MHSLYLLIYLQYYFDYLNLLFSLLYLPFSFRFLFGRCMNYTTNIKDLLELIVKQRILFIYLDDIFLCLK